MTDMVLEHPAPISHEETRNLAAPSHGTALMFAYNFPPIASAGIFRIVRFAKYLPEFGWRPVVVSVDPDCLEERRDPALLDQLPRETVIQRTSIFFPERWLSRTLPGREKRPGAQRERRPEGKDEADPNAAPPARGLREVLRNLRDLVFFTPDPRVWWLVPAVRAGLRAIRKYEPRVIYTTGPPHSTHLIGLALRRLTGLPWVADFRDPWSRQPWGMKPFNPWGNRLLPLFESQVAHYATTMILNTERMADDFRTHHARERPSKFVAVPNGFDPDFRGVVQDLVDAESVSRTADPVRLCHAGSLYARRNTDPLLIALRRLVDAGINVHFEQIGSCEDLGTLMGRITELGLESHVHIEPPIPHREALTRMARSDVLVLIQPDNLLQVPGKLYEMMLFSKPILSLTDEGAASDIITGAQLGEVARGEDPDRIVEAMYRILARSRNGAAGREDNEAAIRAYDGKYLTGKLASLLANAAR